jgi:hypothetical protein
MRHAATLFFLFLFFKKIVGVAFGQDNANANAASPDTDSDSSGEIKSIRIAR